MAIDTGGAMPPERHIKHASSEELRRVIFQASATLAVRLMSPTVSYSASDVLTELAEEAASIEESMHAAEVGG